MTLPEKDIGCHRTGFAKSCRSCVIEHNCRLWKRLDLIVDRETGQLNVETWGCVDEHAHTLMINMLGRQDTTTATVDKLAKEVRDANDAGVAGALMGINAQIRSMTRQEDVARIAHSEAPKQLTGNH